jgi:hypothetical protein
MTDLSIQQRAIPFQPQPLGNAHSDGSSGKGSAVVDTSSAPIPMDTATLGMLTDAVAQRLLAPASGNGRTGASAAPVELRASTITLEDASERLTGIISKLPVLLSALIGGNDPIKTDDGAGIRASEGAAAQFQPRALHDSPATVAGSAPATGADADMGARSASAGEWIKNSPFGNLLALLRQLLLKFEKLDRDNSAQMVILQREMTIVAGDLGVQKARESLGGAIGSAMLTGVIGGAALKQTFKSTSMQTNSTIKNQNTGNRVDVATHDSRGAIKASKTPSNEMRAAHDAQGIPAGNGRDGGPKAAADVQADGQADVAPMRADAISATTKPEAAQLHADDAEVRARAQIPASNAMMLNMLAPSVGGTVGAGVNIEAEMTESERQLMLNVAETFKRVADEQQDQATKTRDMRDATAQLVDSLMNLMASTSGHIIGKY